MIRKVGITLAVVLIGFWGAKAQQENYNYSKFKQLYEELPTPNVYRTASGAPGHEYYQQQADYVMNIELDDDKQIIYGQETITYTNNSPDELTYLWVQLDQNVRAQNSMTSTISTSSMPEQVTFNTLKRQHNDFDGGHKIQWVKQTNGTDLPYTINNTMMRIDLPQPLKTGGKFSFKVKWWYNINNRMEIGGRSGYEFFEEDSNYLYTIAQFYPRMAVYNDVDGWQNKQFLGRGEFTLPFGDFKVSITVPEDHIIGATGELQNASAVLTAEQRNRMKKAQDAENPVLIITEEEAREKEKEKKTGTKTWVFHADNVRDFAFASSRKFMWDAMGVNVGGKRTLCMSYYPKEGNPLWEQYSTRVVAHTIKTYSKYTIDYPYPVAISVHSKSIGMEYPMICFNGGRPEADGTYSEAVKHGMISVIIHEVGHNFFPMIINSDERQWTWMDEGLNTFVQYLTEQEWDRDYPSRRGPAHKMVPYMKGDKAGMVPIMTNSESVKQFGNNAYGKPATALNILRETVMGRELFDYAFKEYARRWAFKHPTPADLFRTMEDASATDLDWFWRGWFFTTDNCDIALNNVKWYKVSSKDPNVEKSIQQKLDEAENPGVSRLRNDSLIEETVVERVEDANDFYNSYDPYAVDQLDEEVYENYINKLSEEEVALLDTNINYYELEFELVGGLVMPVILEFEFVDGTTQYVNIPAEIWKMGDQKVTKIFSFDKEVVRVVLDPLLETADTDRNNNYWPPRMEPTRFEVFKLQNYGRYGRQGENPMQRVKRIQEMNASEAAPAE
tara:strand:+ start:351 stop:2708 length:2358 start_codon:yes stop_codon:yes gene_type:complete